MDTTRRPSSVPGWARGRLRKLNLVMILPPTALSGVLLVALDSTRWWHVAVLGTGVLAAIVAFVRWASGSLSTVAVPCLVVTAVVWPVGLLVVGSATAFYGLAMVAAFVVPQLPRHRAAAAVATVSYLAAFGVVRLLTLPEITNTALVENLIVPTGVTAMILGLMFPNKRFYDVVAELEETREREAEMAVMRERVRFASDLHDIQGHTLHVVKLKVALARKLLHSHLDRVDLDRVDEELREVHALVADTITQTKELAHAQRRLNLSAELENAKNLFEAAGIRVEVDRDAEADSSVSELLGQVLRETTTNILRHAQATEVSITLGRAGITVANDGAGTDPTPELRGLAALRERVAGVGGELTITQSGGRFRTAAAFPVR